MSTGKLIVLYGINNLGKSTQAKLLVEKLRTANLSAEYLKYPIYDLAPSGPLLNAYLRQNNPFNLTPREAQLLYAMNRWHYEPELRRKLTEGTWIIAEDYTGTGLAWGLGGGIEESFLLKINEGLLRENIGILFAGQRFMNAVESGHRHENDNELTERVKLAHEYWAEQYGWQKINANLSIEAIAENIWQLIANQLPPAKN